MKTITNTTFAQKSVLTLIAAMFTVLSASAFTTEPTESVVYQTIQVRTTEKSVILDWNTASENNSGHFEVERATSQGDFKTVAIVLDGFSTEGTGKRYAFKEDINHVNNNQVAYYRLKQVDGNGTVSYSTVVKVNTQK